MSKFKVGDRVKIRPNRGTGWNFEGSMDKYCGEIVTVSKIMGRVFEILEDDGQWVNGKWWFDIDDAELATAPTIAIYTDGRTTTALLKEGKEVVKKSTAALHPSDEFDFDIGAELAFNRLIYGTDYNPKDVAFKKPAFGWDAFKDRKIAVRCTTQEEADTFVSMCEKQGLAGDFKAVGWHWHESDTCYAFGVVKGMGFCTSNWYKNKGLKIVDFLEVFAHSNTAVIKEIRAITERLKDIESKLAEVADE